MGPPAGLCGSAMAKKRQASGGAEPPRQVPRKPVTSYEVAKAAGVSQSAVSRTFSQRGYVSQETRQRVHKAAKELGFKPNAIARSLITQRSRIIAVVMADLQYSFYLSILHQLSKAIRAAGYQVLLISIPSSDEIDDYMPDVIAYRVDGIIIASALLSTKAARLCRDRDIPVVLINRQVTDRGFSSVSADNLFAGRLAAETLAEAGCRRLAFVAGQRETSTSLDREAGFFARTAELGGKRPLRRDGFFTYDGGYRAARDLMRLKGPPDGIFCASDIMAMGALDALRYELGLKVGEDVSVIGCIDAAEAAWKSFELTTIAVDSAAMSTRAVDLLIEQIERPGTAARRESLPVRLVRRKTVRPPKSPASAPQARRDEPTIA